MKKLYNFIYKNKYHILISIILLIGFLVRVIGLENIPYGLNQDEVSAGYESFSLLKYGIDRNGKTLPVHFISWGSGQNTLYSYITIPFILLFGLNAFAIRLPMAIVGCISLIIMYKILEKYGKKITIIGLFIFAICPWHIMKSRWGLESNLFPDLVLWGTYFIIKSIEKNKSILLYIGMAILGISIYSYGTSYLFLPIYILCLLIYLIKKKNIKIKQLIISLLIVFIITLPIIMFVIINTFNLKEIKIGLITIPRVYQNRFQEETTFFSQNLINSLKIIVEQNDGLLFNTLPFYGICYVVSLPFILIGLYNSFKNKKLENNILNMWFIISLLLLIVFKENNINRLNICMIPLVIYVVYGINKISNNRNILHIIILMYGVLFILFTNSYINMLGKKGDVFEQDLKEPLEYVAKLDIEKVYITDSFKEPYIYTLFYTKGSTSEYIETVQYNSKNNAFENIKSYGKFKFYIPKNMDKSNCAYMVPIDYEYDTNIFDEVCFEKYKVLTIKGE